MIRSQRTNTEDLIFLNLVKELDKDLSVTDGEDHKFYNQFNALTNIKHALVVYQDDKAIGCGAIKKFGSNSFEVKRMFVSSTERGNGYGAVILNGLEAWARELGAHSCVLETGVRQQAAIRLYEKCGYKRISNYEQYIGVAGSICFEKEL